MPAEDRASVLEVWDADTGQPVGKLMSGHQNVVNSVAFGPDRRRSVSGSGDTTVGVWPAPAQSGCCAPCSPPT